MKKILINVLILSLVFSGIAFGVDKTSSKKVKKNPDPKVMVENKDDSQSTNQPSNRVINQQSLQENPRDYNDFVDKNNNGIDDRVESKRKTVPATDKTPPDDKVPDDNTTRDSTKQSQP
nr:hypothetical protein [candidate division Zixibacteria bacterium]